MNVLRYLWHNKLLVFVTIASLVGIVYVFNENYQITLMRKIDYLDYQSYRRTYCNESCQVKVMEGMLDPDYVKNNTK